jgi:hypothetical protein
MEDYSHSLSNNASKSGLFKSNYRFIDFKKASDSSTSTKSTSNASSETAESFYLNLISEGEKPKEKKESCYTSIEESKPNKKDNLEMVRQVKRFSPKDLFKAAQNNDVECVKSYSVHNHDLSVLDDFQWNALMIAIAAQSNQVVDYLVNDLNNPRLVDKLLGNKDKSGNDSLKLAKKFRNTEAFNIIETYNKNKLVKSEPLEEANPEDEQEEQVLYCEFCKKEFNTRNETYKEHLASIVHQLNETEQSGDLGKTKFTNYHLRSSNKGYELMLKLGWNETTGLGSNEQGRINPVRAEMKLDRHGIGVVKEKSPLKSKSKIPPVVHRKAKIFKLKKSKPSSDGACLKEYKKDTEKMKKIERNLRFYFDN